MKIILISSAVPAATGEDENQSYGIYLGTNPFRL